MSGGKLQPVWIDTYAGILEVAAACRDAGRFALDTEADSLYAYFHKVCLVQVSANDDHFLIDPLALEGPALAPLWQVVADPELPVLMHGADYDVRVLERDFEARIGGLLDTQIMAQMLGEPRTGLGALLEQELRVRLDKRLQRANWGRRPLPHHLLQYASADTAHLEELVSRFRRRLERVGRWSWALEECATLEAVHYVKPESDPLAFEKIKGARSLRDMDRDRSYCLFCLRDEIARELDIPPFKVIGNQELLQLALKPPESRRQLASVKGVTPRLVRRWGDRLLKCLQRPRKAPPRPRRQPPQRVPAEVRTRTKKLIQLRDEMAGKLQLDAGLLCTKAMAGEIAAASASSLQDLERCGLTGWRLELLGKHFLELL